MMIVRSNLNGKILKSMFIIDYLNSREMDYQVPCEANLIEQLFKRHVKSSYNFIDNSILYSHSIEHYDKDFRRSFAKKLKLSSKLLTKIAMKHSIPSSRPQAERVENIQLDGLKERYEQKLAEYQLNKSKFQEAINKDLEKNVIVKLERYLSQIKLKEEESLALFQEASLEKKLEEAVLGDPAYQASLVKKVKTNQEKVLQLNQLVERLEQSLDTRKDKVDSNFQMMMHLQHTLKTHYP